MYTGYPYGGTSNPKPNTKSTKEETIEKLSQISREFKYLYMECEKPNKLNYQSTWCNESIVLFDKKFGSGKYLELSTKKKKSNSFFNTIFC